MTQVLLIIEPNGQRQARTQAEAQVAYERMVAFSQDLQSRGLLLASQSLKSQADASRVQVRDGKVQVVDGPFAEAKEMVGGFFMLSCQTREEALAIARECPAAEWCTVEVRSLAPCHEESSA